MLVPGRPGTIKGASQNAFHFSRSTTSGVSSTFSSFSGAICCWESRRDAAGDFEFGSQILPEHDPASAALARGQFAHQGLPAANRKLGAQLFPALALPRDFQNAGANLRLQSLLRFIARQVARQILTYTRTYRHGGQK